MALTAARTRAPPARRPAELTEVDDPVPPEASPTTRSKPAVAFGLLEPLRERIQSGMPAHGSCAGLICRPTRSWTAVIECSDPSHPATSVDDRHHLGAGAPPT
ncbi:hypothetical protein [Microbispora sp. KK1-11]|uniref:hypothetical protein n=1 Tax=Microbispora sp. KK1-11 TaxID=2053005 RepID=UPI00115A784B|nr:hypothetical protein [Microbispora sp. KK1-11]TQS20815.1 hypothetical protein FLW16_40255 [Microbispora sp. KK1-11]